jgi:hypothetical protein
VLNERKGSRRAAAIEELFAGDPIMYEPTNVVIGRIAISEVAGSSWSSSCRLLRLCPMASPSDITASAS